MITFDEMDPQLQWAQITSAMIAGHKLPRASITDGFVRRGNDTLLSRAAWIDGLGSMTKCATIVPSNAHRNLPNVNGGAMIFNDQTGLLEAVVDFHLLTKWKTAADSLLGAQLLARPDSKKMLIVGAGTVARTLVSAYSSVFAGTSIKIWNRNAANAQKMVNELEGVANISVAENLETSVGEADIICCATMSTEPVIKGDWLREGQHVDLIGAYRPDMREVDNEALKRSKIFVDSRETTMSHIGELKIPLEAGVITDADILGDFYDLVEGRVQRKTDSEITLFKNGGGAHLDLMTAKAIMDTWAKL
jgi:ornithine cyclodeaminase